MAVPSVTNSTARTSAGEDLVKICPVAGSLLSSRVKRKKNTQKQNAHIVKHKMTLSLSGCLYSAETSRHILKLFPPSGRTPF